MASAIAQTCQSLLVQASMSRALIALFADPETATLPLQLYRLMGAYRMDDAAGASLLLLVLSFAVFWACDRGGRHGTDS